MSVLVKRQTVYLLALYDLDQTVERKKSLLCNSKCSAHRKGGCIH